MAKLIFKAQSLQVRTELAEANAKVGVVIDINTGAIISYTNDELSSINEEIDTYITKLSIYESGDGYGLSIRVKDAHSFWNINTQSIDKSRAVRFASAEEALAKFGFYNEEKFLDTLDERQAIGYLSCFIGQRIGMEVIADVVMAAPIRPTGEDRKELREEVAEAKLAYSNNI